MFTKRPCLEWLQYLWPGEVWSVRCWSLWRQRAVKVCGKMNSYPIKHQQKHHISEKTCPPMIDLIYNNLMNVNNVAIQGEGRGYPRPVQNGNSIIYSSTCVYMHLSVSFKRGANFLTSTFILQINGTCSGKAEVKIFKFSWIHLFAPF